MNIEIRLNGETREVPAPLSIAELLDRFDLPKERVAVERNRSIVPKAQWEAIALAQGLTDFASRDKIAVIRTVNGKTTRIPFNYRRIADGAEQENFFVRPGDIVIVP